ncbi:MAG: hypothetical protein EOM22_12785 [Gammaproteobacteria bacterium]|nr:hypothetical protein [Gammaproteobacteria bacterium]
MVGLETPRIWPQRLRSDKLRTPIENDRPGNSAEHKGKRSLHDYLRTPIFDIGLVTASAADDRGDRV